MDFSAGFAAGYAFAKKKFEGGSDIYITDYADTSLAVTTIADRGENPKTTDYTFAFEIKEFKKATKIKTSSNEITHTWSKLIVTSVTDSDGKTIWTLKPDSHGKIIAVCDSNGNEILNGTTNGKSIITNTPEGVALGYALAYSKEQDELMEKLLEAYEQGTDDQKDIGDDTSEIEIIDFAGGAVIVYSVIDGLGAFYTYYGSYVVIHPNGAAVVYGVFMEEFSDRYGRVTITNHTDPVTYSLGCYRDYIGTAYDPNGAEINK